ncbi:hypothetical protein BDN70DRAFT_878310 [Pholiota conissans]|uniref:Uncharacterized protein n=1 Tax=Pholiota conissans TaxID=109636 RepID=A0A9P5Z2E6_9AGAR|nr:hypothetical protein BDN70DRAFT_878310 [Pholiota conissans]
MVQTVIEDLLTKPVVQARASRSLAQTLPFDILHEIFRHCLPPIDDPELSHQPNPLAPFLFCHVCVILPVYRMVEEYLSGVPPSLFIPPSPAFEENQTSIQDLEDSGKAPFTGSFFRSAYGMRLCVLKEEFSMICSDLAPFPNLIDLGILSTWSGCPYRFSSLILRV